MGEKAVEEKMIFMNIHTLKKVFFLKIKFCKKKLKINKQKEWKKIEVTGNLPKSMSGRAMGYYENKIYLFGG